MKVWVGVTDNQWFSFLSRQGFDEVNFWQPSATPPFVHAPTGMPFLFKLKMPHRDVAGGGFAYSLGQNDPYKALKTMLKAEINEDARATLNSETSRGRTPNDDYGKCNPDELL